MGIKFNLKWSMPNKKMDVKSASIGITQFQVVTFTVDNCLIAKFIDRREQGLHHIALEVDNLDEWVERLKEQ
ncbi:MAG: VOC family protein [candidate division WOR-3 bacterium]|nr:VOC family protein [candidate division WOR-3 bacterium]